MKSQLLLALGLAFCVLSAAGTSRLPVYLDVTKQAGIEFDHCLGAKKISNIVEATGSGAAWVDFDKDGWWDLYLVNGCYLEGVSDPRSPFKGKKITDHLYRNNGNGNFSDVTEKDGCPSG